MARSGGPLPAGALAVLAPRPAARPSLTFLQFLLGPANAALSSHLLLGILDPANELVARQGRDVFPSIERRAVGDQCLAQVRRAGCAPRRPALAGCSCAQGNPRSGFACAPSHFASGRGSTSREPEQSTMCLGVDERSSRDQGQGRRRDGDPDERVRYPASNDYIAQAVRGRVSYADGVCNDRRIRR